MSMDDELSQILSLVLNHNENIDKLNLFIKLKNGNVFKYKLDRVKQMKILENLQRKREKKSRKLDKNSKNKTLENEKE